MGPNEAKIVVRYPDIEGGELRIVWRESHPTMAWNSGPIIALSNERDWVGTTRLTGLWPSTNYECMLKVSILKDILTILIRSTCL